MLSPETRESIKALTGEDVASADEAVTLLLSYADHVTTEHGTTVGQLEQLGNQVAELSAAVNTGGGVIELSTNERKLIERNVALRVDGIAKDRAWSPAYTEQVKAALAGDDLLMLSTSAEGGTSRADVILDLLAQQPVQSLAVAGEQTLMLSLDGEGKPVTAAPGAGAAAGAGAATNPLMAELDRMFPDAAN